MALLRILPTPFVNALACMALMLLASACSNGSVGGSSPPTIPKPILTLEEVYPPRDAVITTLPGSITATFSAPLDASKLSANWMVASVLRVGVPVLAGTLSIHGSAPNSLVLSLAAMPIPGDQVLVRISGAVTGFDGRRLTAEPSWRFTYVDPQATQLIVEQVQQVFERPEPFSLAKLTRTSPTEVGLYFTGVTSHGLTFWNSNSRSWPVPETGVGTAGSTASSSVTDGLGGMILLTLGGQADLWIRRNGQQQEVPRPEVCRFAVDHWAGGPRMWSLGQTHPLVPASCDWDGGGWIPNMPPSPSPSTGSVLWAWTTDRDHLELVEFMGLPGGVQVFSQRRDYRGVAEDARPIVATPFFSAFSLERWPVVATAKDGRAAMAYWRALPFGSQLEVLDFEPGVGWGLPTVLREHTSSNGLGTAMYMTEGGTAMLQCSSLSEHFAYARLGMGAWTLDNAVQTPGEAALRHFASDGSGLWFAEDGVRARRGGKAWSSPVRREALGGLAAGHVTPSWHWVHGWDSVQIDEHRYLCVQTYSGPDQAGRVRHYLQSLEIRLE